MEENEAEQIARMAAEGNQPDVQQPAPAVDYQKLFEEQRAQNAVMQAQVNQSLAIQQQLASHQQIGTPAAAPVDVYAGFAPETAAAIKGVVGSIQQSFEQKFAQQQQEIAQLRAGSAVNEVDAIAGNMPAQVKQYAKDLLKNLKAKGVPVTTQEVVDMAYGQAIREGKMNVGTGNNSQGMPPVLNGGSRQPVSHNRPVNFDQMPLKQQAELLGNQPGFLDKEF